MAKIPKITIILDRTDSCLTDHFDTVPSSSSVAEPLATALPFANQVWILGTLTGYDNTVIKEAVSTWLRTKGNRTEKVFRIWPVRSDHRMV
jgi:hypothetical protein